MIYDRTNGRFKLTKSLLIQGNLTATGSAWIHGSLTASGTITGVGNINAGGNVNAVGSITAKGTLSGTTLRTSGNADIHGNLTASGGIRTDGNITINDDADSNDANLTFGNTSGNQSLKFLNTDQKFQFSKGLNVKGALSGASLTVDGTLNLHGVNLNFPSAQGGANTFLKNDGGGNLSWTATSTGNSSGGILALSPSYPNAAYFASGSTYIGQLAAAYDATNKQNYYHWSSTKAAIQDYWIAIRVRVPDNFSSWDPVKPIEFRYRSTSGTAGVNHLTVKVLDTTNSEVALTNGAGLANTSWTTANIKGVEAAGTFTPKSYFTILVKLATTTAGSADAGFINLNFETTTP